MTKKATGRRTTASRAAKPRAKSTARATASTRKKTTASRSRPRPKATVRYDQLLPPGEVWGLLLAAIGVITLVALSTDIQGKLSIA